MVTSPQTSSSGLSEPDRRVKKAVALKDYAVSKGFEVPDDILNVVNSAESLASSGKGVDSISAVALDKAISEITKVTYPTTGDSLLTPLEAPGAVRWFKLALPVLLLLGLSGAIAGYSQRAAYPIGLSVLAISLGLLGSVVYQIFNVLGVMQEKAFTLDDVYANWLRISLGPAIGWVFYFSFCRAAFANMLPPTADKVATDPNVLLLLLPFLSGFSIKLVVGIMEKVIQSVMLVFGIEDKRTEILARRRRNQETSTAVSGIGGGDASSIKGSNKTS